MSYEIPCRPCSKCRQAFHSRHQVILPNNDTVAFGYLRWSDDAKQNNKLMNHGAQYVWRTNTRHQKWSNILSTCPLSSTSTQIPYHHQRRSKIHFEKKSELTTQQALPRSAILTWISHTSRTGSGRFSIDNRWSGTEEVRRSIAPSPALRKIDQDQERNEKMFPPGSNLSICLSHLSSWRRR